MISSRFRLHAARFLLVAFVSLSQTPLPAFGAVAKGGIGAHGGSSVVCYRDSERKSIERVEFYDFWVGDQYHRGSLQLGEGGYGDRLETLFRRIEKADPERASRYRKRAATFESETAFLERSLLSELDDSFAAVEQRSPLCYKEQFVVQLIEPARTQARYLVDRRIWDACDAACRAGIVFHELVLHDAVTLSGHRDSNGTRNYVNAVARTSDADFTLGNYARDLRESGFSGENAIVLANGYAVQAESLAFDGNGFVESAILARETTGELPVGKVTLAGGSKITFHPDGMPSKFRIARDFTWAGPRESVHIGAETVPLGELRAQGGPTVVHPFECGFVTLHPSGELESACTSASASNVITIGGKQLTLRASSPVLFHAGGAVKLFANAHDFAVARKEGTPLTVHSDIRNYDTGKVVGHGYSLWNPDGAFAGHGDYRVVSGP